MSPNEVLSLRAKMTLSPNRTRRCWMENKALKARIAELELSPSSREDAEELIGATVTRLRESVRGGFLEGFSTSGLPLARVRLAAPVRGTGFGTGAAAPCRRFGRR